jgi:hypothetical protein
MSPVGKVLLLLLLQGQYMLVGALYARRIIYKCIEVLMFRIRTISVVPTSIVFVGDVGHWKGIQANC